jgi:trimeric autotransporter adhesin
VLWAFARCASGKSPARRRLPGRQHSGRDQRPFEPHHRPKQYSNSLSSTTTSGSNTAIGAGALRFNTSVENTAVGFQALFRNTTGQSNTATGFAALQLNTTGRFNTATGLEALRNNTTGSNNTAMGFFASFDNTGGHDNTATGFAALGANTKGSDNIALGSHAGINVFTADNVICIGAGGANVSDSCYIGNIFNRPSPSGLAVFVNSDGKLGTIMSSRRFKEDIKPMDKASEAILAFQPVAFRYKKDFDPTGTAQFGLVAEDVAKVNPDLVVRDKEGKPYSVRYDQVNAMLLNEFLKEHRKVQELEADAERQQKQIQALTAGLQKVSAQLEASKPAPQVVNNNQ